MSTLLARLTAIVSHLRDERDQLLAEVADLNEQLGNATTNNAADVEAVVSSQVDAAALEAFVSELEAQLPQQ